MHDPLWGRRVRIKFQVEESGKLTGEFDVWMEARKPLAAWRARLNELAAQCGSWRTRAGLESCPDDYMGAAARRLSITALNSASDLPRANDDALGRSATRSA